MKKVLLIASLALLAVTATAQEDKQTFTRKMVIEQFTTAQCGWCPSGADRITSAVSGNNNVIWIKHHAGFGTDDLTNDIAERMTVFYGGSTFAPAMMVDRTRFDASNPGPVGSVGNVSEIRKLLADAKAVATYCKVYTPEVGYDPATRHLHGSVSGRFSDHVYTENTRLVVYVIEDSIFMEQHDYNNGSSANGYAVDYWHFGTVRDTITSMWGEPMQVDEDNNMAFSYDIDYTLPDNFVYKNCRVVAIVYNYDANNVNNCPVLNAAISDYLDQHVGIGEVSARCQARLFPNPANGPVVIESDASMQRVDVLNALGQVCLSQNAGQSTRQVLNTAALRPGTYIVRIVTTDGTATRKLVVQH